MDPCGNRAVGSDDHHAAIGGAGADIGLAAGVVSLAGGACGGAASWGRGRSSSLGGLDSTRYFWFGQAVGKFG